MKWEVQQGIYDALSIEFGVDVSVCDGHAGNSRKFPYITLGRISSRPISTHGDDMDLVNITIHTWSRKKGNKECMKLMERIDSALNRQDFEIVGYQLIDSRIVTSECLSDPDGKTRHGIQTFNLSVDKII